MKRILTLTCIILFINLSLKAQQVQYNANGSYYKKCVGFYVSKPLRELVSERNAKKGKGEPGVAADAEEHGKQGKSIQRTLNPGVSIIDGARQSQNGTIKSAGPIVNIDGQQSSQGYYPLDPNGMIGSNYYVQTINVDYAVYNKSGDTILPPTNMNGLFTGTADDGDPVTLYDKTADRWVITEFNTACMSCSLNTLMFAVSTTNDPTGSYYVYTFIPDTFNTDDYPKYVVWSDGYYCTGNFASNDYVIVFQRDSMLAGSPNAGFITIPWNDSPRNFTGGNGGPGFFCPMMLDCDGTLPPYGSPEFLFYYWDDNWNAGGNDEICIDKITVDWTNKTGQSSHYDTLLTAPFNSTFTGGSLADIPQPGNLSTNFLDALDGFFAYRIPYLRWASYNSAVMCNTVNVGDALHRVAGIRWYELRQDTTTKAWSIYQQSTYAPDDRVSRWNPSIAMDQNGSIGLQYTVSDSASIYPGCRYTARRASDALNTMTTNEIDVYAGNAIALTPQGQGNRWGDYSHLSVDPNDGITFWATNMYTHSGYGHGQNIGTRIYSFQINRSTADVADVTNNNAASLTAYQNGNTLIIKGTGFPTNERLAVQLFDVEGKMLLQKNITATTNILETSFNVSTLAKAIYLVRIGNDHIQRVLKTPLN